VKARFVTFGCKLNQSETEGLACAFRRAGYAVDASDADADVIVVNTCAVTTKAEQKARRLIRRLLASNPRSSVIVTGCYAQLGKAQLERLDAGAGRLFIVPGDDKAELLALPEELGQGAPPDQALSGLAGGAHDRFSLHPAELSFHSRPTLKIQDGCDNACAYCAVQLARGPSVSLAPEDALSRLKALEESGFGEAALVGVNIGQYRSGSIGLAEFLERLLLGTKSVALRLSSLEPNAFSDALFAILRHPRIRPHFHLSVQSCSEKILRSMGRPYTAEELFRIIERLREAKGDPFLACDVITGFPGETKKEFEETMRFCANADFAWIHAFPFSPRPGTAAFSLPGGIPPREAAARVQALSSLAQQGRLRYAERHAGREVTAICEDGRPGGDHFPALSENYLRLLVAAPDTPRPPRGREFRCRITRAAQAAPRVDALGEMI
jgi:threonylcarbamoyladenosine tRNA methylthiotransferase MtaB